MLDLQPRIHLKEIEALVLPRDKLDGSGGIVIDGPGESHGLFAHLATGGLVEQRRRRLLDDFLVAALNRTFALAEIDHMAMLVADHLNFDVAGINDEFLDENAIVAERRFGFGLGQTESLGDLRGRMRDPHPFAAAAGGGLDHDRITDLIGDLDRVLLVLDDAEMARNGGDVGFGGGFLGFDLVAHRGDGARIGSNENDSGFRQRARKGLALGQEPIARMHGLGAGLAAGLDDPVDQQITFGCRRRPDQNGVIGHFDVERVPVGLGIDRDGLDPHAPGSLDDPTGDLAAIGD